MRIILSEKNGLELLQCSLLQESYCSNSKKKKIGKVYLLERLLELILWVFFPKKMTLASLLEML